MKSSANVSSGLWPRFIRTCASGWQTVSVCRRRNLRTCRTPPRPAPRSVSWGRRWPVAGRQVGIVIGVEFDTAEVQTLRTTLSAAGVVPLVVGPRGGVLGGVTVQRSYAVAASVEFDAVVVASAVPPAPDAQPTVDAKADAASSGADPRVVKLLGELWRHAKAIGGTDTPRKCSPPPVSPPASASCAATRSPSPTACSSFWGRTASGNGSRRCQAPDLRTARGWPADRRHAPTAPARRRPGRLVCLWSSGSPRGVSS